MVLYVNDPKQIIQVNNTVFTWIRIEVGHHSKLEISQNEVENMGILVLHAYSEILQVDFDIEGATCIPLTELENMKKTLHQYGLKKEDHMLTVGGSSMQKRTTLVAQSIKNLTRLALDVELKSHIKRIGNITDQEFHDLSPTLLSTNLDGTPKLSLVNSLKSNKSFERRLPESNFMSNLRSNALQEGGFVTTADDILPFEGMEIEMTGGTAASPSLQRENEIAMKQVLEGGNRTSIWNLERGEEPSWAAELEGGDDLEGAMGPNLDPGATSRNRKSLHL